MIKNFKCTETEKIFNGKFSKRFPPEIQELALRILTHLDAATDFRFLRFLFSGGGRAEKLLGDRQGLYSVRINEQWRICFEWEKNNALNVEIVDYH